jgi:hypothetical protein
MLDTNELEQKLNQGDAELLGEHEGRDWWNKQTVVRIGEDFFHTFYKTGSQGPVEQVEAIDQREARRLLLEFGYPLEEVAQNTK